MSNRRTEDKRAAKSGDLSVEDLQKVAGGIIFVGGITASKPATGEKEPIILAEQDLAKAVGGTSIYLKLDDVTGQSTSNSHPDQITLSGFPAQPIKPTNLIGEVK